MTANAEADAVDSSRGSSVMPASPREGFAMTRWDWLVAVAPLLGMLPLWIRQAINMNDELRVFYVPIVLLVIVWCSILNMRSAQAVVQGRLFTAVGLMALSLVVYAIAVWNYSPWLSHVAAVVVFSAWALGRWGSSSWQHVAGVTLLLATTLPWPANLDDAFAAWLDRAAAGAASAVLDGFATPNHLSDDSLLTKSLQIELSQISGYGSIFSLLALVAVTGLVLHRSFLHCILLGFSAIVWLGTAMSAAMLLCIWTTQVYGLGVQVSAFLAAVIAIVLTDQFLAAMLRPVPVSDPEDELQFGLSNVFLCWPQRDALMDEIPEDPEEQEELLRLRAFSEQERARKTLVAWHQVPQAMWSVSFLSLLFVSLGVLPTIVLARQTKQPDFEHISEAEIESTVAIDLTSEEALPNRVGNWTRINLPTSATAPIDAEFHLKYAWQGQGIDLYVVFPKPGWEGRAVLPDTKVKADLERLFVETDRGWRIAMVQSTNPFGGARYIWQSALGDDLKPFRPVSAEERLERQELSRIPIMQMMSPHWDADYSPTYHMIADYESGRLLSDPEQLAFQANFEEFCELVRGKMPLGKLTELIDTRATAE